MKWGKGAIGLIVLCAAVFGADFAYRWASSYDLTARVLGKRQVTIPAGPGRTTYWEIKTDKGTFKIADYYGIWPPGGADALAARISEGQTLVLKVAPPGLIFSWEDPSILEAGQP